MSAWFDPRPAGGADREASPRAWVQPGPHDREQRAWSVRAAEWRALGLARAVFGPAARVRLAGGLREGRFSGLLEVTVPFADLDDHVEREAVFLGLAAADALLAEVPLVYLFTPDPDAAPRLPAGRRPAWTAPELRP